MTPGHSKAKSSRPEATPIDSTEKKERKPRGRPISLTPEIRDKIVSLVGKGNYIETAAASAGISKDTLYRWLREGARYKSGIQREFSDAVARACAQSEVDAHQKLLNAETEDGKLILERMARRFSDRWGAKQRVEAQVEHSGSLTLKIVNGSVKELSKNKDSRNKKKETTAGDKN
jgi:transposase